MLYFLQHPQIITNHCAIKSLATKSVKHLILGALLAEQYSRLQLGTLHV